MTGTLLIAAVCALLWPARAGAQSESAGAVSTRVGVQGDITNTVHNLTPLGPGKIREKKVQSGVCVYCHTPHDAKPTRGLWNRQMPAVTYKLYESSTMQATLSQPTGTSRLCLSCHDGVIALSKVRVPPKNGILTLGQLTGNTVLGTDLSGSHPISFVYNNSLAAKAGELAQPSALPRTAPLEDATDLQCSTCHDPHETRWPNFLRTDNRYSAQCTLCHKMTGWTVSSHATSNARWKAGGKNPFPADGYGTVAENACLSCHRPHAAPHPEWLLAQTDEPSNCTICHDGTMAQKNIAQQLLLPSSHPILSKQWNHKPKEDPLSMARHVTCADCHNPHAAGSASKSESSMRAASKITFITSGPLFGVSGVGMSGTYVQQASHEYEICLKCHGIAEPTTPGIVRQDTTRNIRMKIRPTNQSFHPIVTQGKDPTIAGLEAGYTASSIISCIDCHNNDRWTPAGSSPKGPHGSRWAPILAQEYETDDPYLESMSSYALCYTCHNRSTLLFGSGHFPHQKHVVQNQTSCAVCHDPHGSQRSPRLINFMIMSKTGAPVVRRSSSGRLEFDPAPGLGGHGSCYLKCHGVDHNPKKY
ncbi:MAG TPA: cytochrome c3 family protein [Candidatus Binataceae bacterium]|nr:cytochrome c3 family protein [Candidatus Binataceae bacterium]